MNNVIALVADDNYLPHAKSVMVNCRRQGKWAEDFCLILPPDCDRADLESRGIHVLTDPGEAHFRKFALCDRFFEQWRKVLYLDCDVIVQAPIEPLLHELKWGEILADNEPFDLMHAFTHFAEPPELKAEASLNTFRWMWQHHDPAQLQFNTGIMLWYPRTLPPNSREELRLMRERLEPINNHCWNGTDQPIFNLVFDGLFRPIRSDLFCYYETAWDETIIVHTCSGYAPWIEKASDMDCYFNDKLRLPCNDIYKENLSLFDETFPKR